LPLGALVLLGLAQGLTAQEIPPAVTPKAIPPGEWNIVSVRQEIDGPNRRLFGAPGVQAVVEDSRMIFRADQIDYNVDTGDLHARGNVYFQSFENNERVWATRLDYNTETKTGRFDTVRGEMQPKIVARPGILSGSSPFHFEGEWAERIEGKYILHNGWITNCKIPRPWWRLKGPKFDIVPGDRAISYRSTFFLRKVPIFYSPFLYHSLAKEPRKSGFLMPNLGNSTRRGLMVGIGYYWAVNRSTDVTYRLQDYTARGFTHHVDFRTRPNDRTDFGAVLYGVQDRGVPNTGPPKTKYSGVSLYAVGRSDLGKGWTANGYINYITSFRFRQEWTESFNEAIQSEIHSLGFADKKWSSYTLDIVLSRLQNFQAAEIAVTDPETRRVTYETNAVTIRKLPEAQFSGSDRQIGKLPLWLSFRSSAGLLYRSAPVFEGSTLVDRVETGQFNNRVHFAPYITSAFHLLGFHLVPSLGIRETYYSQGQTPVDDRYRVVGTNLIRSAGDFSLDLVFPTISRVFQKPSVFGDKLKHGIEPRATYRYVTGIGKDFNKFIRFDETDLLSDTNEVELSLTNRVYAKRGDDVREIFTWQLMQKRYFDPTFGGALLEGRRNIFESTARLTAYAFLIGRRRFSPIASLLRMNPVGSLGVQWQADYDPQSNGIVDSALSMDYRWQNYLVSAGHNQVHTDPLLTPAANQFRFQVGYGDTNRRGWNAGFITLYDYRQSFIQYSTAQVTYNTDCCGWSVQFRRIGYTQVRNEWRAAFTIANVGSFGTLRKQDRIF
jgi:LPS-assembly protein